ncbi:hypothetical protein [Mucilaginibacter pedocola]|uniref:Lipoprotein n=1 Tax=Mucilaginibacter pedocola TaxID=1792845 RepID=A0A1S9P7R5_9SPHI|nr:hypothetical protein [Mucilaginibacter pedocola]OOQ56991.1 hypothetical protein BC343_15735 [Mucilaginibacter pedocola]
MFRITLWLLPFALGVALMFSGCKLDAPVYPKDIQTGDTTTTDTVTVPDVDDGSNPPTDATYTVPVGAANTIVFKVDGGETVILNAPTAKVSQPGSVAVTGYTNLVAEQADPEIVFQLNFSAISEGEYANDLLGLRYQNFILSDDSGGKVKASTFKKIDGAYHIRGFFRVEATDQNDNSKHLVEGSFNIEE